MNANEYAMVFVAGIVFTLVIAGIVAVIVADHRHLCKHCRVNGKGHKTQKVCRIFVLPINRDDPVGMRTVKVYVFRNCSVSWRHTTCQITQKLMMNEEIHSKMLRGEDDWSSDEIKNLCYYAKTKNPACSPVQVICCQTN